MSVFRVVHKRCYSYTAVFCEWGSVGAAATFHLNHNQQTKYRMGRKCAPPSSLLPPPSSLLPPSLLPPPAGLLLGMGDVYGIYLNLQPQNLRVLHDQLIRESVNHVVLLLAFCAADCCALRRGHVPDIALILQRVHQFEPGICLRSRPTFRRMVFCHCSHSFANRKQQRDLRAHEISRPTPIS